MKLFGASILSLMGLSPFLLAKMASAGACSDLSLVTSKHKGSVVQGGAVSFKFKVNFVEVEVKYLSSLIVHFLIVRRIVHL